MESVQSAEAIAERGLQGDRYASDRNRKDAGQQITLIEVEWIERFVAETGLAMVPREPCAKWARNTHMEVVRFFVHRGGLNARILKGGAIAVGSSVVEQAGNSG